MEKFWKRWLKANCLEKVEIIEGLRLRAHLKALEIDALSDKEKDRLVAQLLNSYFEDLAYVTAVKTGECIRRERWGKVKRREQKNAPH